MGGPTGLNCSATSRGALSPSWYAWPSLCCLPPSLPCSITSLCCLPSSLLFISSCRGGIGIQLHFLRGLLQVGHLELSQRLMSSLQHALWCRILVTVGRACRIHTRSVAIYMLDTLQSVQVSCNKVHYLSCINADASMLTSLGWIGQVFHCPKLRFVLTLLPQ